MPKVLPHEVPPFETPRACSVAATALGDETLLVGAEMVVQCLGEAAGEAEHGSLWAVATLSLRPGCQDSGEGSGSTASRD